MNISEANATNRLLRYLLAEAPSEDEHAHAQEDATFLASRAKAALGAGPGRDQVRERWPQRPHRRGQ
ncbi:hypothetical protein [Amycolatopsis sp. YIM 10]|uniref:hypothetical protein n=1 Tax=Amycolatopsis sp. YIM 10 TaxID=2653857 RepID=UPI0012906651|nr:hypothetical protein [Amycolatopsis sp. YIM 10]QFU87849.1 hypothetical protein YIM_13315 [Amycolatopsis sp. YIM 10]QFU94838.1 hypothetical protein YIM_48565 [Amycolatopsis sp. YIM 10]